MPVGAIAVWNDLPDQIKRDSTFANFQEDFAIQQSNNATTSDQSVPEIVVTKEASLSPFLSRRANDSKSKSKCVDEDDEADLPMSWVRRLTQIVLFLVWVFSIVSFYYFILIIILAPLDFRYNKNHSSSFLASFLLSVFVKT